VGALDGDTLDIFQRLRPDSQQYECYAWECLSTNIRTLNAWIKKHGKGLNVTIIGKAAWTENTSLQFLANHPNAGKIQLEKDETSVSTIAVEALDVAEWLMHSFQKSDFIFLKIDIETAEFQVLPHIIQTGAIEYIDELQLEWHDWRDFASPERTKKRTEIEEMLKASKLIYQYATFDKYTFGDDNTDWAKVPKYRKPEEFPVPWVDLHYFRRAEGCHSPWDESELTP
jgi:FkbM family methyltransferase